MTARTTIASAVSRYLRLEDEADDCADEVIMALERAGFVMRPREPTCAMQVAGLEAMAASERASQRRADALLSPRNDFQRGADAGGILARNSDNLKAAYQAMINAPEDTTHGA